MTEISNDLISKLQERERALKKELEEIKMLKAAIKGVSSANTPTRKRTRSPNDEPTFKSMIKSVLKDKGSGAEALELLDLIYDTFGKTIKRTSISPQLSRLKAEGELVLIGKEWWLHGHVAASLTNLEEERPPAKAEGLSNEGEGWNQQGIPRPPSAGSIPVSSTPNLEGGVTPSGFTSGKLMPGYNKE